MHTFCLFQVPQLDCATRCSSYDYLFCTVEGDTLHRTLMSRQALQSIWPIAVKPFGDGDLLTSDSVMLPFYTVLSALTRTAVGFPIAQTLTFLSSPPVTSTPADFLPIFKQLTLEVCATNSCSLYARFILDRSEFTAKSVDLQDCCDQWLHQQGSRSNTIPCILEPHQ